MLNNWDPTRILKKKPFVCAMIGNRRSGKSTTQSWLLQNILNKDFDLYISFAGAISCSPETRDFFLSRGMEDMMFDRLSVKFLKILMKQQERHKVLGKRRQVLLLLDDAELTREDEMFLGVFCTRARHFDVSIIQCSVSYTLLKPNFRRSLDILFLFSMGMYSDRYLMLREFSNNPKLSLYAMQELEQFQCLVQEKDHESKLFYFKVTQNTKDDSLDKTENLADPLLANTVEESDLQGDSLPDLQSTVTVV